METKPTAPPPPYAAPAGPTAGPTLVQQPGQQQVHGPGGHTVIVTGLPQVQVIQNSPVGPLPQHMTCPRCHAQITTRTQSSAGSTAWLIGILLCFVGCWCCACIPCCMDSMQETNHYCPSCNAFLGRYRP